MHADDADGSDSSDASLSPTAPIPIGEGEGEHSRGISPCQSWLMVNTVAGLLA